MFGTRVMRMQPTRAFAFPTPVSFSSRPVTRDSDRTSGRKLLTHVAEGEPERYGPPRKTVTLAQ